MPGGDRADLGNRRSRPLLIGLHRQPQPLPARKMPGRMPAGGVEHVERQLQPVAFLGIDRQRQPG